MTGQYARYIYFGPSKRRLGLAGPSLMESGRDECETSGMLSSVRKVMQQMDVGITLGHVTL